MGSHRVRPAGQAGRARRSTPGRRPRGRHVRRPGGTTGHQGGARHRARSPVRHLSGRGARAAWALLLTAARVLIAGVSARAAAASAERAGFAVSLLDAFADLDLPAGVRGLSLPRDFGAPFTAGAVARAARDLACDAVVYLSSFENHPDAVSTLAAGRRLRGNAPAVLRRVRNPRLLMRACRQRGIPAPAVIMSANDPNDSNDRNDWLI